MPYADREKRNAYARAKYHNDPRYRSRHLASVRRIGLRQRADLDRIVADFRANGCAKCSERAPCCLDAHHRDPSQKDMNIGSARSNRCGTKTLIAELLKCVCVCRNCHAKIHAGLLALDES
jgi:hypothetical protein